MADFIIRTDEGNDPLIATPLWDTIWNTDLDDPNGASGDWAVADPEIEVSNIGGLQSQDNLATAILMCLFTDRRRPDWIQALDGSSPRGWHGDTFDLDDMAGERAMGSLLWTLERSAISDDLGRTVEGYVRECLQTLIDQGRVYNIDVSTEIDHINGTLAFFVRAYNKTGQTIFKNSFPFIG